jgi:aldose 1-epimerase
MVVQGEINVFVIENSNGTRLTVSNLGAAVISLLVKDRSGHLTDIVLGYEDAADYMQDEFYFGTVVGRYANRVAGDTVMIEGLPYKLSTRDGRYHLHGGKMGFNKKLFTAAPFHKPGKSGIVFTYTSPHLEEGFPGELKFEVKYTLDDSDAWTVEYKACTDRTTLINPTQHTYFNLSGNPSTSIDGHELKIPANYYLPVNSLQVPAGAIAEVANTPFDFRLFKEISRDITIDDEQLLLSNGYDHSFVLEKEHTPLLKHAAIVKEPVSGRKIDVYTTEPSVHLYTGNYLQNVKGKNGVVYNKRSGFCLETHHFPDAPNHPHFPSTVLKAGEEYRSKTVFKFSVY